MMLDIHIGKLRKPTPGLSDMVVYSLHSDGAKQHSRASVFERKWWFREVGMA